MSCVVKMVDSVHTDGQSVEEDASSNKMKESVTDILIHRHPANIASLTYNVFFYLSIHNSFLCRQHNRRRYVVHPTLCPLTHFIGNPVIYIIPLRVC